MSEEQHIITAEVHSVPPTETNNDDIVDLEEEWDIQHLKSQLGIDTILQAINTLSERVAKRADEGDNTIQTKRAKLVSSDQEEFDPSSPMASITEKDASSTASAEDESIIPSIFEEKDAFGPNISELLAKRINSACTTKPVESKMKELEEKYLTPENCAQLIVPKVNLELWFDLQKSVRVKDLALQEVQKYIVKAAQPLLLALDKVLKANKEKTQLNPADILQELVDSMSFIGHSCYQVSMKRRDCLRQHINKQYQTVASKNTQVTKWLFGDDLAKNIKDIGEVNKISKKVSTAPPAKDYRRYNDSRQSQSYNRTTRGTFLRYRKGYPHGRNRGRNSADYSSSSTSTHSTTTNQKT